MIHKSVNHQIVSLLIRQDASPNGTHDSQVVTLAILFCTFGALKPSTEGAYYLRPWQRPWNLFPIVRAIRC